MSVATPEGLFEDLQEGTVAKSEAVALYQNTRRTLAETKKMLMEQRVYALNQINFHESECKAYQNVVRDITIFLGDEDEPMSSREG